MTLKTRLGLVQGNGAVR